MKKRIFTILLALCMMVPIIPNCAFAAEETEVPASYFSLGIPVPVKDSATTTKWTFPDVKLIDKGTELIKYAKIEFASSFVAGSDSLHLDSNGKFTTTTNARGTQIEITPIGENLTNQDWVDYLKGFYAILTSDSIEYAISITSRIEDTPADETSEYLYRAETDHYYQYVDAGGSITWAKALEEAGKKEHLGRQGYLLTITTEEEQKYVESLVAMILGWMGGTCNFAHYPETISPSADQKNKENFAKLADPNKTFEKLKQNNDAWYWADGADDERGVVFYPSGTCNTAYDNFFQYTNWDRVKGGRQPDHGIGSEPYMQFFGTAHGTWNDVSMADGGVVRGYFVEYGGKATDEPVNEDRTSVIISPSGVGNPTITSQFNEEVGTDPKLVIKDCVTTIKGEKIKPESFILKKESTPDSGNYGDVPGAEGTGRYQMIASYKDADGNSYYSEKNAKIEAIKLKIQLKGLDTSPDGYNNFIKEISMEPGSSYVAEAPEIDGYTVDVPQQTVDNIKLSKTIVFTYTKQEKCNVTVKLEGLADAPADWPGYTKTEQAVKGQSYTAVAPVVEGYLVDRYAATLDPVTEDTTITFHYVKEGEGSKGCNVKVVLKDVDTGKTLSAEGYATSYVVEKGAGITLAAPGIPGYVLTGEETFTAAAVTKNTTVTFTYKKIPEYTVTVKLAGLNEGDMPTGYPTEVKVPKGGSYTAIAPQIEGYTVDKLMDSVENVTEPQTITFTYTKPPAELGPYEVTVELLEDVSNEKIDPPEGFISKFYVAKGGGFSLTHPTVNGYNYSRASNASLTPVNGPQEVKFYYTKPVTVTHTVTIILKGASLAGYPKTITVSDGDDYIAIAPLINGKKADKYSVPLTNITKDETIIFEYKNVKGPSTPKPPEEEPEKSPVGDVLNADDHILYMVGHASGLFGPEGDLTRAQCAQIFYNLLLDKDAVQRVSFPDVPEDKWYARAIETLAGMDVLQGYNDGTFQPEKSITRAEFTAIAMRFGELDQSGENPFPDVTEDRWYYSDVVGSAKYGWIQGYTDGTFRPEEKISRTEVTYIVNRMLKRTADQAYIDANPEALASFPDLPRSYWGYYSIMEATNAHDHTWKDQAEVWTKIR